MPSTNQQGSGSQYRNEAHRVFALDMDPLPMIRGIEDADRAKQWWNEAHRCDASEPVTFRIKKRMQELR
jgi:hypothetical protein